MSIRDAILAGTQRESAAVTEHDDYVTHHADWVDACERVQSMCDDPSDIAYWQHQLDTLARLKAVRTPDEVARLQERVHGLLRANNALVERARRAEAMVAKARDQFYFYRDQHRAKNTKDADKKAEVNEALAGECEVVIGQRFQA